jgi:hypothetical protein
MSDTKKALIEMSEYNELIRIKQQMPKIYIKVNYWYSRFPTVITTGELPHEITDTIAEYHKASGELEKLEKVPKWVLNFFNWL